MNNVVVMLIASAAVVVAFNITRSVNSNTSSGPPNPGDKPSPSTNPGPDVKLKTQDVVDKVKGLWADALPYGTPLVGELNMVGEAAILAEKGIRNVTHLPTTNYSKYANAWSAQASKDIEHTMGGVRTSLHNATDAIGLHDTIVQKGVDAYYYGVTEAVGTTASTAVVAGTAVIGMANDAESIAEVKVIKPAADAVSAAGADIGEAAASGMEMISTSASNAASTLADAVTHPAATITALEDHVASNVNQAITNVATPVQTVAHVVEQAPIVQAVSQAASHAASDAAKAAADAAKAAKDLACKIPFIPC